MALSEGRMLPNGAYQAVDDSPHRSLTREEAMDLRQYAETTTPDFTGPNNAKWEDHHPLAREVWERKGLKPKE